MYSKLESLRGIAACLVVLFHSPFIFFEDQISFVSNSYLFVDLFFILSGFVISFAYTEKIKSGLSFKIFISLRLGRLYPIHLFMLFVFLLFGIAQLYLSPGAFEEDEINPNNIFSFISNIFLIQSLGIHDYLSWNKPSWSISVELFTYIAFFIFLKSIDKHNRLFVPIIISTLCYSYLFIMVKDNLDITYDFGILRCIAGFYLGVFLFRAKAKFKQITLKENLAEVSSFLFVILAVSFAHYGVIFQILSIVSFFFLLVVFSNSKNGVLGRVLHNNTIRKVGVWSYSIYMIHSIVINVVGAFTNQIIKVNPLSIHGFETIAINILILLITITLSRFTYIYIEDKYRNVVKHKYVKTRKISK